MITSHLVHWWLDGGYRSRAWQESRDNVPVRPSGGACGQDNCAGRRSHGQESHWEMASRKGQHSGVCHLAVADRQILSWPWVSRSHSGVRKRGWLDRLTLLPQYRMNACNWSWTVGNRSHTPNVRCKSGTATSSWSHDSASVWWYADSYQTDGAPGPWARAITRKCNQQAC